MTAKISKKKGNNKMMLSIAFITIMAITLALSLAGVCIEYRKAKGSIVTSDKLSRMYENGEISFW